MFDRILQITIGFLAATLLVLVGFGLWILIGAPPEFAAAARDTAVVVMGIMQLATSIVLIVLLLSILLVISLIYKYVQGDVLPRINELNSKVNAILDTTHSVADNARATSQTVTHTTTFAAEQVATPIIRVSSMVSGVRAAARALARRDEAPASPAANLERSSPEPPPPQNTD